GVLPPQVYVLGICRAGRVGFDVSPPARFARHAFGVLRAPHCLAALARSSEPFLSGPAGSGSSETAPGRLRAPCGLATALEVVRGGETAPHALVARGGARVVGLATPAGIVGDAVEDLGHGIEDAGQLAVGPAGVVQRVVAEALRRDADLEDPALARLGH